MKEIKTILGLVILILYLIVTLMIMWCRIKGNKELEGSRLKDINLLRGLKKQGFFKGVPGTATIKDILANCEVFE